MFRHQAVRILHPEVVTTVDNKSYDSSGALIKVDEAKVAEEVKKFQAESVSKQYQRDRQLEYPSIEDQLDKIYHSGIDAWKKDIKAVKDKFPKPK